MELQETWVSSLGGDDPLEEEMTTHSSILPGESHGERSLVSHSPWYNKESDRSEHACMHAPSDIRIITFIM